MVQPHSHDGNARPLERQVKVSDALERKLRGYALGAGAAAGLLALSQPLKAEIVFTPADVSLHAGSTFAIQIGGATEFTLTDRYYIITGSFSTALLSATGAASASVVGRGGSAAALRSGAPIGPKVPFQAGKALLAGGFRETQISASTVFGPFANTTDRYLGLKFKIHGEVHYGWVRFKMVNASDDPPSVTAVLMGYAFETEPNLPLKAGQTAESPLAAAPSSRVPALESGTLGRLALGSAGINAWRKRQAQEAH